MLDDPRVTAAMQNLEETLLALRNTPDEIDAVKKATAKVRSAAFRLDEDVKALRARRRHRRAGPESA
ncbi:hypothetical protein FXF51_02195 [Nonomuraea sp. PA05]|uniref:hypothetical protein n=1 Tax=Nonomuraea sp. PA05 TaxID=2604466 RepID=UPI0011D3146D|nr:hypothetical protein [Nonomuraea sp. PA05]TYB71267.1 hypothetical protein FXF51_02195 [Nonomuraea sp. PA05]